MLFSHVPSILYERIYHLAKQDNISQKFKLGLLDSFAILLNDFRLFQDSLECAEMGLKIKEDDIFKSRQIDCYFNMENFNAAYEILETLNDKNLALLFKIRLFIRSNNLNVDVIIKRFSNVNSLSEFGLEEINNVYYKVLNIDFFIYKEQIDFSIELIEKFMNEDIYHNYRSSYVPTFSPFIFNILSLYPNKYDQKVYDFYTKMAQKFPEIYDALDYSSISIKLLFLIKIEPEKFEENLEKLHIYY